MGGAETDCCNKGIVFWSDHKHRFDCTLWVIIRIASGGESNE